MKVVSRAWQWEWHVPVSEKEDVTLEENKTTRRKSPYRSNRLLLLRREMPRHVSKEALGPQLTAGRHFFTDEIPWPLSLWVRFDFISKEKSTRWEFLASATKFMTLVTIQRS